MNCYYHPEIVAVAQCGSCGKGLCRKCAEGQSTIRCIECVDKIKLSKKYKEDYERETEKKKKHKRLLISVVIFLVSFILLQSNEEILEEGTKIYHISSNFITAYMSAGIPWGWNTLTKFGVQGTFKGWNLPGFITVWDADTVLHITLIKSFFKFIASFFIGWFFLTKEFIMYLKK